MGSGVSISSEVEDVEIVFEIAVDIFLRGCESVSLSAAGLCRCKNQSSINDQVGPDMNERPHSHSRLSWDAILK